MTKKKGGRPKIISESILAKLEEAFLGGHTDREACLIANIDPATLYRYCNEHESFAIRKELLKENPTIDARRAVVKTIKFDPDMAMKYLERKRKDEFSLRSEMDLTSNGEQIAGFTLIKKEIKDDPTKTDLPGDTPNK
jgi:hypothetical protein